MKIFFRVVSGILSVCVFLSAFFLDFFRVVVNILGVQTDGAMSIYKLINTLTSSGDEESLIDTSMLLENIKKSKEALKPLLTPAIVFLVFFSLALLIALSILIINIVKTMKKTTLFLSLGGLACVIAMFVSFNKFAAPIISGSINVFNLLDLGTILRLASSLVNFDVFGITSGGIFMAFSFIALFIWSISNIVIDLGDNKN